MVWISFYLSLKHIDVVDAADVKARFRFSLLDERGEASQSYTEGWGEIQSFKTADHCWGHQRFIKKAALEKSPYLKDDCFRVQCDVTVSKEFRVEDTTQFVTVPPSDMHRHFADLLQVGEGADVTFQVAGEIFAGHRYILAARSPVFKAELFGPMKEKTMNSIKINDMEARVFKAMLHFIYTDTMPDIDKDDAQI
nr:unnamed protein product [Digitaria exilis]